MKEILEMAASAVGIEWERYEDGVLTLSPRWYKLTAGTKTWDPLNSDVDAFDAMIRLGITIRSHNEQNQRYVDAAAGPYSESICRVFMDGGTPESAKAAVRKAITIAAARVGLSRLSDKLLGPQPIQQDQ